MHFIINICYLFSLFSKKTLCETFIEMISEIDLKVLWKELDRYETELNGESKVLEDVWIKISDLKKKNDEDIAL